MESNEGKFPDETISPSSQGEEKEFISKAEDATLTESVAGSTVSVVEDREAEDEQHLVAASSDQQELQEDVYNEDEEPHRRLLSLPTREQFLGWLPFLGLVLLGAILRFWGLGDKPLHHDESLHAYYSLQLMKNDLQNWASCFNSNAGGCYHYDPLLHGPFQFHAIATIYQISQWLGAPDHGVNTTTVRIAAATLGSVMIGLPYFLRDYLGRVGALLASFLLAVSPSLVYFSRFAREDIYMACFTMLLVVAMGQYVRTRRTRWLVIAGIAFALSYATKEATFLTVAVFGSFLGALVAWELGVRWPLLARLSLNVGSNGQKTFDLHLSRTWAPVALLGYFLLLAPLAKFFFDWMKSLSVFITDPKNVSVSDAYVQHLEDTTVTIVPWIGVALGLFVLVILGRELLGKLPLPGRRGLATKVDPDRQPILDTLFTMPWTHWFFAILAGWTIFLILFTVLFTDIPGGIGKGIWQGLYYWLQQQQKARGAQPWYYYFMLIPLYEQIGLVFGLVGLVRCLLRPNRFRLFLAYWFVGNVFIYSWAAEKMPWLMIHMTMPMMLLAAIGLEPAVLKVIDLVKNLLQRSREKQANRIAKSEPGVQLPVWSKIGRRAAGSALFTCGLALLLLAPTLQNMYQVTYVHAADGPHEMMIYVQTTPDVNTVMAKVDALDQKLYGGKHQLAIGLGNFATWPWIWYLRDYPNVCLNYPQGCPTTATSIPIIIVAQEDASYGNPSQYTATYSYRQYQMRSWWDEGYKPVPCVPSQTVLCDSGQLGGGVGLGLWLSYGDTPPPDAKFDLGRAVNNIWQWWWQRKAIGSTGGIYGMDLFIRNDLGVTP